MKKKLKLIVGIYVLFNAIVACCPEPLNHVWTIKDFTVNEEIYHYDRPLSFTFNPVREISSSSSLLAQLGPSKTYALSCEEDQYTLATKFTGISIISDSTFSETEPAGTELKQHFNFFDGRRSKSADNFEEIMNLHFGNTYRSSEFYFRANLIDNPPSGLLQNFTFTFFVEDGDDIVVKGSLTELF